MKKKISKEEISSPDNLRHVAHVDRSATVDELVSALQSQVEPIDNRVLPDAVPLPTRAMPHSLRGALTPTFYVSTSSPNLLSVAAPSTGYSTWNGGANSKIRRSKMPDFISRKSVAPLASSTPSEGRSMPTDDPLASIGYVNVKNFGHPYETLSSSPLYAENQRYLSPNSVLSPTWKQRASTISVHEHAKVVFRPPRESSPLRPRDSHHETSSNTVVAAPDRITVQLARPTDLFGPSTGFGRIPLDIDDVVPIACPGSLDSGVAECAFPPPAAAAAAAAAAPEQQESVPTTLVSPQEVKEYLERLKHFYEDLKESNQLDSEGFLQREKLLAPAAELILSDMSAVTSRKSRAAPPPPIDEAAAAPEAAAPAAPAASETAAPAALAAPAASETAATAAPAADADPLLDHPIPKPRKSKASAQSEEGVHATTLPPSPVASCVSDDADEEVTRL